MEEAERLVEMAKKNTINETGGEDGEMEAWRERKVWAWVGMRHSAWFQLNTDFMIRWGSGGLGCNSGCGYGSSKTHNFLQSENQILKMTGLISVLSEPGSRREGDAGGLSATICQGKLETIRAEWKGRWLLLSSGALWAGTPDVAMHIKEQEANSLIQEACRGKWAMPQRSKRRQRIWWVGASSL